jgi:hypothetical protein
MRRTKAAAIYDQARSLRAERLLLRHTNIDCTLCYSGVQVEDALSIAEKIEI